MLRQIFFIARKDLHFTLRAKETIIWVFVMPIVFFYFIGTITGGSHFTGPVGEPLAIDAADDSGFLAEQMALRLEQGGYDIEHPETRDAFDAFSRRLVIPPAFTDSVLSGNQVTLRFTTVDDDQGKQYDQLRAQRATYTVLADLIALEQGSRPVTPEQFAELAAMPRSLGLVVEAAGKRKTIPSGYEHVIPGIMVMFTVMVLLTSAAWNGTLTKRARNSAFVSRW